MKITANQLREHRTRGHYICDPQILIFEQEWGQGEVEITIPNLLRAIELGLKIEWLARAFLPIEARERFNKEDDKAWERYQVASAGVIVQLFEEESK